MTNLNEMKAAELKEMAKALRISNWWNMKKDDLIKKITEAQATETIEAADATETPDAPTELEATEEVISIEEQAAREYAKNWGTYTRKWLSKSDFLKAVAEGKIVIDDSGKIEVVDEDLKPKAAKAKTEEKPIEETPVEEKPAEEKKEKKEAKKKNLKIKDVTYKGETKSIREWAEEIGMPWPTLYDRINRNGWTVEDAIETPLGQRRPRS